MAYEPHNDVQFSGGPPAGLPDPGRPNQDYAAKFNVIGGSRPDDGKHFEDGYTKPDGNPAPGSYFNLGVSSDPNGLGHLCG